MNPEVLDACLAWLAAQGHPLVLGKHLRARAGHLAGSDAERLEDLLVLVRDPRVAVILCARGGYGVGRILRGIPAAELRASRKLVVGYSDATLLLSFLHTCAGLTSLHGPMLEREDVTAEARARQLALMRGEPAGLAALFGRAVRAGVVEAPLVGGNLKLLQASIGTEWQVDLRGAVVFLEEVSEAPYALDRALVHLRDAGVLEGVRGVALGQLVRCESERYPGSSAGETVREILSDCIDGPIVEDLPFGHVADNHALGVGVRCRLDGARGELRLLEPVVEVDS